MTDGAHLDNAAWLKDGEIARLLVLLDRDGEEARVVGGAVRNAMMELPVGEIDVATTAVPEEIVRRAEAAGFKAKPTGIEYGTITVIIDGQPFEVTTLREDVETFGRKAKVVFGRDWKADAERRDFTSTRCRRRLTARFTTMSAGSTTSPRIGCDLSAIQGSGLPKTICASCGSFAFTPATAKARRMRPDYTPASLRAQASILCRASGCGWNCSSSCWRRTLRRRSR
jgi:hypothetical protein